MKTQKSTSTVGNTTIIPTFELGSWNTAFSVPSQGLIRTVYDWSNIITTGVAPSLEECTEIYRGTDAMLVDYWGQGSPYGVRQSSKYMIVCKGWFTPVSAQTVTFGCAGKGDALLKINGTQVFSTTTAAHLSGTRYLSGNYSFKTTSAYQIEARYWTEGLGNGYSFIWTTGGQKIPVGAGRCHTQSTRLLSASIPDVIGADIDVSNERIPQLRFTIPLSLSRAGTTPRGGWVYDKVSDSLLHRAYDKATYDYVLKKNRLVGCSVGYCTGNFTTRHIASGSNTKALWRFRRDLTDQVGVNHLRPSGAGIGNRPNISTNWRDGISEQRRSALAFSATPSAYLFVPSGVQDAIIATGNFTIEAIFKCQSNDSGRAFGLLWNRWYDAAINWKGYYFAIDGNGKLFFQLGSDKGNAGSSFTTQAVDDGKTHYAVLTVKRDSTDWGANDAVTAIIDGVKRDELSLTNASGSISGGDIGDSDDKSQLLIGGAKNNDNATFLGLTYATGVVLDELHITSGLLTSATISATWAGTSAKKDEMYTQFRGHISDWEYNENDDTITVTCLGIEHQLNFQYNKNYPDNASYWVAGYFGNNTTTEPDGTDKPIAYDNWPMQYAIRDLMIRGQVDGDSFFGRKEKRKANGEIATSRDLFDGKKVILKRPLNYGNPDMTLSEARALGLKADDKYLYPSQLSESLWQRSTDIADQFGYVINFDSEGKAQIVARNNPTTVIPISGFTFQDGVWTSASHARCLDGQYYKLGNHYGLNIMQNPGFEGGDTSNWTVYGDGKIWAVYGGAEGSTYACRLSADFVSGAGMQQKYVNNYSQGEFLYANCWVRKTQSDTIENFFSVTGTSARGGLVRTVTKVEGTDSEFGQAYYYVALDHQIGYNEGENDISMLKLWYSTTAPATGVLEPPYLNISGAKNNKLWWMAPQSKNLDTSVSARITAPIKLDVLGKFSIIESPGRESTTGIASVVEFNNNPQDVGWIQLGPSMPDNPHPNDPIGGFGYEITGSSTTAVIVRIFFEYPNAATNTYEIDVDDIAVLDYQAVTGAGSAEFHFTGAKMDLIFGLYPTAAPALVKISSGDNTNVVVSGYVFPSAPRNLFYYDTMEGIAQKSPCVVNILHEGNSLGYGRYKCIVSASFSNIRLDGAFIYDQDIDRPIEILATDQDITSLRIDSNANEQRNDAIFIGSRKTTEVAEGEEAQWDKIANPNNPLVPFVVSRTVDTDSICNPDSRNYIGKPRMSIVIDGGINNQRVADWLSLSFIEKYRDPKPGGLIRVLGYPLIELYDPVAVIDRRYAMLGPSDTLYVKGYRHNIKTTQDGIIDFQTELDLTSYKEFSSFEQVREVPNWIFPNDITNVNIEYNGQAWDGTKYVTSARKVSNPSYEGKLTSGTKTFIDYPFYDPYFSEDPFNAYVNIKFDIIREGWYQVAVVGGPGMGDAQGKVVAWLTNPDADPNDESAHWEQMYQQTSKDYNWDGVDQTSNWNNHFARTNIPVDDVDVPKGYYSHNHTIGYLTAACLNNAAGSATIKYGKFYLRVKSKLTREDNSPDDIFVYNSSDDSKYIYTHLGDELVCCFSACDYDQTQYLSAGYNLVTGGHDYQSVILPRYTTYGQTSAQNSGAYFQVVPSGGNNGVFANRHYVYELQVQPWVFSNVHYLNRGVAKTLLEAPHVSNDNDIPNTLHFLHTCYRTFKSVPITNLTSPNFRTKTSFIEFYPDDYLYDYNDAEGEITWDWSKLGIPNPVLLANDLGETAPKFWDSNFASSWLSYVFQFRCLVRDKSGRRTYCYPPDQDAYYMNEDVLGRRYYPRAQCYSRNFIDTRHIDAIRSDNEWEVNKMDGTNIVTNGATDAFTSGIMLKSSGWGAWGPYQVINPWNPTGAIVSGVSQWVDDQHYEGLFMRVTGTDALIEMYGTYGDSVQHPVTIDRIVGTTSGSVESGCYMLIGSFPHNYTRMPAWNSTYGGLMQRGEWPFFALKGSPTDIAIQNDAVTEGNADSNGVEEEWWYSGDEAQQHVDPYFNSMTPSHILRIGIKNYYWYDFGYNMTDEEAGHGSWVSDDFGHADSYNYTDIIWILGAIPTQGK